MSPQVASRMLLEKNTGGSVPLDGEEIVRSGPGMCCKVFLVWLWILHPNCFPHLDEVRCFNENMLSGLCLCINEK